MKTFELDYTCNSRERRTLTAKTKNHKVQLMDSSLSGNKNQIGPRELHEVGP